MTQNTSRGFTLWLTGLPCSGKTTLAEALLKELCPLVPAIENLDGDILRKGLCKDLGFSKEDRDRNIERTAYVASLLTKNGTAAIVSFVSPYRQTRDNARKLIGRFIEVYVRCPLEVCEKRDVKGMYRKARLGEIPNFTGVSDPYEEPQNPEIILDTAAQSLEACVNTVLEFLDKHDFIIKNPFPESPLLTRAFELASIHHFGQKRKGGAPYLTHPVAVAKMLKEAGAGVDILAAGLLHDVLEDTGCEIEELEKTAGKRVAFIVAELTDKDKTAPWVQRKKNYLDGLSKASKDALWVACADKIHNLECLIEGQSGPKVFADSFSASLEEKKSNFSNIFTLLALRLEGCPLLARYKCALDNLRK